jgi:cystathionine beta-lyase
VPYLERNRDTLRDLVAEDIPGAWMPTPEGTFVGWIDFRSAGLGDAPAEFFRREASVGLTEGTMCGVAGTGFARLIFATPRPVLEHVVRRLGAALRARPEA